MTTVEILAKARALIARPDAWTQGCLARDATGRPVQPISDESCRWCAYGAIVFAAGPSDGSYPPTSYVAASTFDTPSHFTSIAYFNDSPETTHADVIQAFDRSIAALGCAK